MYVRVVFYHRHVISGDTTHRKGEREREREVGPDRDGRWGGNARGTG